MFTIIIICVCFFTFVFSVGGNKSKTEEKAKKGKQTLLELIIRGELKYKKDAIDYIHTIHKTFHSSLGIQYFQGFKGALRRGTCSFCEELLLLIDDSFKNSDNIN